MPIVELYGKGLEIEDVTPLADLPLKVLKLVNNQISDLSPWSVLLIRSKCCLLMVIRWLILPGFGSCLRELSAEGCRVQELPNCAHVPLRRCYWLKTISHRCLGWWNVPD